MPCLFTYVVTLYLSWLKTYFRWSCRTARPIYIHLLSGLISLLTYPLTDGRVKPTVRMTHLLTPNLLTYRWSYRTSPSK